MALKGSGKRRQAPAYSADAMAVRYMAGLVLIALGALVFMAVELRLQGNIFEGLRRITFGLCGIMAYVLPALPVWAGVLVIWSTQRRAPVRPWLFAVLAFFGLCTFMMVTGAMQYLRDAYGNQWGAVINGAKYAQWGKDWDGKEITDQEASFLLPWTSADKAIKGGAKWIASGYIDKGQNTLYFQKFDVLDDGTEKYNHQYAQNIMMAYSEGRRYPAEVPGQYWTDAQGPPGCADT